MLSNEKPEIFIFVVSPWAGALFETLSIISVIKFEASDDSDDDIIGIPTYNCSPVVTGVCSIINSAAAGELLKTCISNLIEQGMKDHETIREKIKKTYKNRYFIYRQAAQSAEL